MHAVRCPYCAGMSRIPADALGKSVACPHCRRTFAARPDAAPAPKPVPVVHPAFGHEPDSHAGPASVLVGLALLPFGIPLLWLVAPLLSGVESVFSFAVPVAVAVGMAGLCLGVVVTADWPHATRVRSVLALVLVGYGAAAFLYFVKKDWLETARKQLGGVEGRWQPFSPEDRAYTVSLPWRAKDIDSPLPGWGLRAVRSADPRQRSTNVYVAAAGPPPEALAAAKDEDYFAAVRKLVVDEAGGAEPAEVEVRHAGKPGRQYHVTLPDRITNRTVRVFRDRARAVYLAVDGVALGADHGDVKKFFNTLKLAE